MIKPVLPSVCCHFTLRQWAVCSCPLSYIFAYVRMRAKRRNQRLKTCSMYKTDLFHLFLSDGVTPHLFNRVKITPLHKKGPTTSPKNYRLLAINGCIYRLFANVVRDLLTDWALAEHQIPDSQFGFCPTRNTNQPQFIQMKVYTAFLDLFAAYNSVPREKLWRHLQKNKTPQYLRDHLNHVHRMPIPTHWWRQNFWGGCAQQRLETGLPSKSPSVIPL